jgi:hypothetical protein
MSCLFELYSCYYEAAAGLESDALSALWNDATGLHAPESTVAAQALEDSGMDLPRSGRTRFCRMHLPDEDCPRARLGGGRT